MILQYFLSLSWGLWVLRDRQSFISNFSLPRRDKSLIWRDVSCSFVRLCHLTGLVCSLLIYIDQQNVPPARSSAASSNIMFDVGSAQGSRSSPGNIGQTRKKNQTYKNIGINYNEACFLPFFYTCNSSIQHARDLGRLKQDLACLFNFKSPAL